MFENQADYKKMEYTSNRLRKEFIALGRVARQEDRKHYLSSLRNKTPWEHLSEDERDQCSWDAISVKMRTRKLLSSIVSSRYY